MRRQDDAGASLRKASNYHDKFFHPLNPGRFNADAASSPISPLELPTRHPEDPENLTYGKARHCLQPITAGRQFSNGHYLLRTELRDGIHGLAIPTAGRCRTWRIRQQRDCHLGRPCARPAADYLSILEPSGPRGRRCPFPSASHPVCHDGLVLMFGLPGNGSDESRLVCQEGQRDCSGRCECVGRDSGTASSKARDVGRCPAHESERRSKSAGRERSAERSVINASSRLCRGGERTSACRKWRTCRHHFGRSGNARTTCT